MDQTAESALRAALLDMLVQMPEHLLATPELTIWNFQHIKR